jgi:hypothetical protein
MACSSCAERRKLIGQGLQNIRTGNTAAVKQNAVRFMQTVRTDLRNIRSPMTLRPPQRPR